MRETTPYRNISRERHTEQAWTPEEIDYVRNNYETKTDAVMAAHLGRSRNSLTGKRNRLNLTKKESNNETIRNTKNTIKPFGGYLSNQKSYRGFEQGGRCELEAVA